MYLSLINSSVTLLTEWLFRSEYIPKGTLIIERYLRLLLNLFSIVIIIKLVLFLSYYIRVLVLI